MVAAVKSVAVELRARGSIFVRARHRRLHVYSLTGSIMQP